MNPRAMLRLAAVALSCGISLATLGAWLDSVNTLALSLSALGLSIWLVLMRNHGAHP